MKENSYDILLCKYIVAVLAVRASPLSLELLIWQLPFTLMLTVVHELIHGITWGIFAEKHFQSINFGVIWKMLTLYCHCSVPLKKWQYVLGAAMPTLVLGAGLE